MFIVNKKLWKVRLVPPGHPMLRRADGSVSIGSCNNYNRTIYIDWTLQGELFEKVLCHEITHAVIFSYQIKIPYEQEELFANVMANYGQEILVIKDILLETLK